MRVVFVAKAVPPDYNGAGRGAFYQAKALLARGVDARMIAAHVTPETPLEETLEGVRIERLPQPQIGGAFMQDQVFFLVCSLWLIRYRREYDVIQFATGFRHWYSLFATVKMLGKPTYSCMTLLGGDDLRTLSQLRSGALLLYMVRNLSGIFSISEMLRQKSLSQVNDPNYIHTVRRIIDTELFRPAWDAEEKRQLRATHNVPQDAFVIVFSGSVVKRKGTDLLVEAMPRVLEKVPHAKLYIAGPTHTRNKMNVGEHEGFIGQLKQRIQELGIADQVVLLGEMGPHIHEWLRLADAFSLPSRSEGLGKAILEAMVSGVPSVIGEAEWTADEIIKHEETGFIVPRNPQSLAEAFIRIAENPDEMTTIIERAVAHVRELYSSDIISEKMETIYQNALELERE